MIIKKITVQTLFLFCLAAMSGQAQEQISDYAVKQERIIRFHADIKIETDGRIEVAEHIKVYAAGREIKRGIVRELPLKRRDKNNKRVQMNYGILSVKCDGADSKYHTATASDKFKIYIGEENVRLKAGEHDYVIVYECYGQIGFFDDYDDLYWNITGVEWIFPIEQASAAITLPAGAKVIQTAFYTGKYGEAGKDCTVEDRGKIQAFKTTRALEPREGLTVGVGFTRGIIARPPPPTEDELYWQENGKKVYALWCFLICAVYFLITRIAAGKRPPRQTVIPLFRPPRDLPPAAVVYLKDPNLNEFQEKAFPSTLIEMAVKGALSIHCKKKTYGKNEYALVNRKNMEKLRPEEKDIHAALFDGKDELPVNDVYSSRFSKARSGLHSSVYRRWNTKDYLKLHHLAAGMGGLLLNAVFCLYFWLTGMDPAVALGFTAASPFIIYEIKTMFVNTPKGEVMRGATWFLGVSITILAIGFMMVFSDYDGDDIHWLSALFFSGMSLLYIIYAKRMRMHTPDGAKLAAELEGFKMYMKTAEERRLNMLNPPERTPELFEKLLPYAMALGVSNEWCQKFGDVLMRFSYRPDWYDDANFLSSGFTVAAFTGVFSSLSSSFSTSVGSASSSGSDSWGSGSDGGGYSGGGGGGGGGRGW